MSKARPYVTDLAIRSFRHVADQDYIAARICYRHGLMLQFTWMSLQAVEKYLKAILVFNDVDTKPVGHSVNTALRMVSQIPGFSLDFSDEVISFIGYLNDHGPNRYLEKVHFNYRGQLVDLDRTVWQIRRYCKVLNYDIALSDGSTRNMLEPELDHIHRWGQRQDPHNFHLIGGHLERVIQDRNHPQREPLIWNNLFYGSRARKSVTIPTRFNAVNPTHVLHPEHFQEYAKLVKFSKPVQESIRKLLKDSD